MTKRDSSTPRNISIATVTTDSFFVGTLVTLYSFLQNNSWFDGEIYIINKDLKNQYRQNLKLLYGKIVFLDVSEKITEKIEEFIRILPEFSGRKARFFSLETFRIRDAEKVMFLDSDLLFRQSIEELFNLPHKLIACGDAGFYDGKGRNWRAEKKGETQKESEFLFDTFNAGFFILDNSLLNDKNYSGILDLIDSRIYKKRNIKLTDQAILNLFFAGQQHLVSGTYNFLLAHRELIYEKESINLKDAHMIHFNGRYKPWITKQVFENSLNDLHFLKACGFWVDTYLECLEKLHFKNTHERFFK